MPTLVKLELFGDNNEPFALSALTPTSGVAFRFVDGRVLDFEDRGVFPLHGTLEVLLSDELDLLRIGQTIDARQTPELTHVLSEVLGIGHRPPRATVRASIAKDRPPSRRVLRARYLEPWLGSSDADEPAEDAALLDVTAFVHARQHVTGRWSQTRLDRDRGLWTIETGPSLENCREIGTHGTFFGAQGAADADSHPGGCDGHGCGDWVPRFKNETEWRRLGLIS